MASQPTGEKTEKPSPQRLKEAQDQGQIAKSHDLTMAFGLLFFIGALALSPRVWLGRLITYFQHAIRKSTQQGITGDSAILAISVFFETLFLPLIALVFALLFSGLFQSKGLITFKTIQLDFSKITPSLKTIFSVHSLKEIAKGIIKLMFVSLISYWALRNALSGIISLCLTTDQGVLIALGTASKTMFIRITALLIGLGVADFLWERHSHLKSLQMTRDEVKRESKENEGDPHHKGERQRLHREIMQQRMLNDVKKAHFIVVNPDHIAIAIQYDQSQSSAPIVLAKGENLLAEKIKEIARENQIPIFRDVTLARSLRHVEEGDEIPEALYEAIAELLAVIETMSEKKTISDSTEPSPLSDDHSHWMRG